MIFLYFASDTFASRAKVLTDSIKKYHPDDTIVHVKPEDGPLGTYLPGMHKKRLEKALEILEKTDEHVIIIGADCELFSHIGIDFRYEKSDVYIVPHVKKPLKNREYMKQIYTTGHANADFIMFRNCKNSIDILKWLIEMTEDGKEDGAFYEQTWLSSIPFLFEDVSIISHPGYNVAYWDINHVTLTKEINYYVDNCPLILFHYSGYIKGEPEKMSRHSQELCNNPIALEIYKNYDARIEN